MTSAVGGAPSAGAGVHVEPTTRAGRALSLGGRVVKGGLEGGVNLLKGAAIHGTILLLGGRASLYNLSGEPGTEPFFEPMRKIIRTTCSPLAFYNYFFNPELFEPTKAEIPSRAKAFYQTAESILSYVKASGEKIPETFDPAEILSSQCPKEEFYKQLSTFTDSFIDEGTKLAVPGRELEISGALHVLIDAPINEEILFRGIIQDLLLKRLARKVIEKIAPQHAGKLDSKIYTGIRILVSALAFSYWHETNRGILPDLSVDIQKLYTAVFGVGLGILKERFGLAASIGAHMMQNAGPALSSLASKC